MTDDDSQDEPDPVHRLLLAYTRQPASDRAAFAFSFDRRCAVILQSTREPMIGQMRLTWWRDVLTTPATRRPTGEPLIARLNAVTDGPDADLVAMVNGWEHLLPAETAVDLAAFAQGRGEGMFAFVFRQELSIAQRAAARVWALWDLARHSSDPAGRADALNMGRDWGATAEGASFGRAAGALTILARLAQRDVDKGALTPDLHTPAVFARVVGTGLRSLMGGAR